ncbi:MAG: DNA-binding protein [Epsilonproteobacteria bacterium]|jgi:uncharacterized metal-binding protein YceD (DUF177 family)|nr:DNA-binding protein [Sulfurospirillum cavolei]NCB54458.1 DNA-binding protein [Campylobacterota bacterium]
MVVEFKKIPVSGIHFETRTGDVHFCGEAVKVDKTLVKCNGKLSGTLQHACDRCAETFCLPIEETVEVFASEGLYTDKEGEELLNVIEFFEGSIDFDMMMQSEIEAFKSDYHYCGQCELLKGE